MCSLLIKHDIFQYYKKNGVMHVDKLNKLYLAMVQYFFREGKRELGFDDVPYMNFMETLFPRVRANHYYDDDIFFYTVNNHLKDLKTVPEQADKNINSLLEYINNNFEINKGVHYLIFPLQGSGLKNDIEFSEFHFIIEKDEPEIFKRIASITGISERDVTSFLEHTKASRSPDFLKDNLVVFRMENQTSYVNRRAYRAAQHIIYYLYLIHTAFVMETSIFRLAYGWTQDNGHVAILAQDNWRQGHGFSWQARLKCELDIDFLNEERYQKLFSDLYDTFQLGKDADDLTQKFLNALILFNRGIHQRHFFKDDSLALLLYLTAAESLLTESHNEKRLRLCAILSRIACIDKITQSMLANTLNDLYLKRNNFVHAGESAYFDSEDRQLDLL